MEIWLHKFLTAALDGREWSTSGTSYFTPGERTCDTHRIVVWLDQKACLDSCEEEKKSLSLAGN
jgi:hypothetical protein